MSKKISKLEEASNKLSIIINETRNLNEELGFFNYALYNDLRIIQSQMEDIMHVPHEEILKYKWSKNVCERYYTTVKPIIEKYDTKISVEKNSGAAVFGIGAGIATLGPTAAMGVATTFGVASTGTAISSLSGAAAYNAALAWLGGGALIANGGGMTAGSALLALTGPIGWTIAGVAFLGSGWFIWKARKDKEIIEKLFLLINKRDQINYGSAIHDMKNRLKNVKKDIEILNGAIKNIGTFGTDYRAMTQSQQYSLGDFYNQMKASSALLLKPIKGLVPKYTDIDIHSFLDRHAELKERYENQINLLLYFAKLLDLVEINEYERKLLSEMYRKNENFCKEMKIDDKNIINIELMNIVQKFLSECSTK